MLFDVRQAAIGKMTIEIVCGMKPFEVSVAENFVFEVGQRARKQMIFVLVVFIKSGAVHHRFVAYVHDTDFFDRSRFEQSKQRVCQ